jgi:putative nucleotidyltransferase with HDIG domain
MVTLFTLLTEIAVKYDLFNVYIIPYSVIPIVVRTFFDSRTAQTTHLVTILICSLLIPLSFEFVLLQLIVSWVAIYVLKDLSKRSELMKCALFIFAAYILAYLGLLLFQEGNFLKINERLLMYFGINFLFVLFTYPFIYILEKVFGYISNVTLVELSDINTPVLKQLSESCPGTFQHSLQVSMLGVAAATKVDANPQLIRTGALYHDLGKMKNPNFFIENKIEGYNPHENLSFEESARIITDHVPEGVKIAEKHDIPQAIVKFIKTHHGKGKAKFFYNSFRNQFPDAEIDEEVFSYSCDNPDTKETAILMMADSVEAASRSLTEYTEESIRNLVNKIIDMQIADGLLSESPLTFKNITDIKSVFVERLLSVYHSRIAYPELDKK